MLNIMNNPYDSIRAVEWKNDHLVLLDQRKLPHAEKYIELYSAEDTAEAIRNMVVRGAPAIGIAAAYAMVMAARKCYKQYPHDWRLRLEAEKDVLSNARPTAINLHWALKTMSDHLDQISADSDPIPSLLQLAQHIHEDDIAGNIRMGTLGSALLPQSCSVLTHGNTGSLATGGYGTALGVIRSAFNQGKIEKVYASETRPTLQGARLTAWELSKENIPMQLMAEGAAAHLMSKGRIAAVLVGADCIAANGDVIHKIGTYSLAVNARHHGIPFIVIAPMSSFDLNSDTGSTVQLEERPADELLMVNNQRIAIQHVDAWNPVFDMTPAHLVDMIVTEKGVIDTPDNEKITDLFYS